MKPVRGTVAAILIAAVLGTASACTSAPVTTPTPKESTAVPVATLADAQTRLRTQLDTIIALLMAASPHVTHDPAEIRIGPSPCGENGPAYQVTAVDRLLLPGAEHRAVLAAVDSQLQAKGFDTVSLTDFPAGGAELTVSHPDGYSATISTGKGNTSLGIIVTSTCMTTPDGTYPG